MIIGAQMYSVKDYTKNLDDFSESLKKLADIGFSSVQVSGTCEFEPDWLRDELKKNGLTCDLTHASYAKMLENPKQVVDDHKIFGCKYIGIGSMPDVWNKELGRKDFDKFIADAMPIAKSFKENGAYFMYHNHSPEFKVLDGVNFMDLSAEKFSADEMGYILDLYWVKAAEHDPVEWLKKLKGRIPCIHYKDIIYLEDGTRRFAPVGSGLLNWKDIIDTSLDLGVEYAFIEQDNCYGEDPFECLKRSYEYLKSFGLK